MVGEIKQICDGIEWEIVVVNIPNPFIPNDKNETTNAKMILQLGTLKPNNWVSPRNVNVNGSFVVGVDDDDVDCCDWFTKGRPLSSSRIVPPNPEIFTIFVISSLISFLLNKMK